MQVISSLPGPIRIVEGRPESSRYAIFGAAADFRELVSQALAAHGFEMHETDRDAEVDAKQLLQRGAID